MNIPMTGIAESHGNPMFNLLRNCPAVCQNYGTILYSLSNIGAEKAMATHSSTLAWRIPRTGKPDGLLSLVLHRAGQDWSDLAAATSAMQGNSMCGKQQCNLSRLRALAKSSWKTLMRKPVIVTVQKGWWKMDYEFNLMWKRCHDFHLFLFYPSWVFLTTKSNSVNLLHIRPHRIYYQLSTQLFTWGTY